MYGCVLQRSLCIFPADKIFVCDVKYLNAEKTPLLALCTINKHFLFFSCSVPKLATNSI